MVEPLSIAAAAASLVYRSVKIAKAISDFRGAYKRAPLVFVSISVECSIISATLSRIQHLALAESASLAARFEGEPQLSEVFANVLESLARVYSLLEDDLSKMTERDKIKIVWDEKSLETKLGLIRGQELAIVTLLMIMQTETMGEIRSFLFKSKGGIDALVNETSILMEEAASIRGVVSSTAPDTDDKLFGDADIGDTASVMSISGFDDEIKWTAVYQRAAVRKEGAASLLTVPEENSREGRAEKRVSKEQREEPKSFEDLAREDSNTGAVNLALSGKQDQIDTAFQIHHDYLVGHGALLDKQNAAFAAAQQDYQRGMEALVKKRNGLMQMLANRTGRALADANPDSDEASRLRGELERIVERLKECAVNAPEESA